MYFKSLKKFVISAFIVITFSYVSSSSADTEIATLGSISNFTGFAIVDCFDDGNGAPDFAFARVKDDSPPVSGLLVNVQLFKDGKANAVTDLISGDDDFSPFVRLTAGAGAYAMLVNKTAAGVRNFDIEWRCFAANGTETGNNITLLQFGVP